MFDFAAGTFSFNGASDTLSTDASGFLVTGSSRTNLEPYAGSLLVGTTINGLGLGASGTGVTAPDGTATAFKLNEDASLGPHLAYSGAFRTVAANGTLTGVFVLQAAQRGFALVIIQDTIGSNFNATVDLTTGAVVGGVINTGTIISATAVNTGTGNWWQVTITGKVDPLQTSVLVGIYLSDTVGNTVYQGVPGSGINAWRMDLFQAATGFPILSEDLPTTQQSATGPMWELVSTDAGAALRITGGVFTNVSAVGQRAGYFDFNLNNGNNCRRVSATWTFTAGGGGTGGAAGLVIWKTHFTSITLSDTGMHLAIGESTWTLLKIIAGAPTTLGFGAFVPPPSIYATTATTSGNTVTITLPDATVVQVTDPAIGANAGQWCTLEVFQVDAAIDRKVQFLTGTLGN